MTFTYTRLFASIVGACTLGAACARAPFGGSSRPECDRECLRGYADRYFNALARRDTSGLPVSPFVRFTENGQQLRIGEGFWRKADGSGKYRVYVADPREGQVGVQAVMREAGADVLVMARLKVVERQITEIETLVVHEGESGVWEPARLMSLPPVYEAIVPEGQRSRREDLLRITNSYFTALQTQGTLEYRRAPFARNATRIENGVLATNDSTAANSLFHLSAAEQFDRGMFRGRRVEDRRYPAVDVERGTVLAIVTFRWPDSSSRAVLLSELFKIANDSLQEIRAIQIDRRHGAVIGWP